jgi:DtxR family transcriptional regulator, Mn-dependent transcriptional regulator
MTQEEAHARTQGGARAIVQDGADAMTQDADLTSAMQDYLRAIHDLGRLERPVKTTALARALGVAPASVTGMVKRLASNGLVSHRRYAGVALTPAGERIALAVIRRHRLLETFLSDALGLSWDKLHEEAHRLEHHVSEELGDRMDEVLGHPIRSPHGAPIPPKNGAYTEPELASLADAATGQRLIIRAVADDDAARLRYLDHLGMVPDAEIEIAEVAPFGGPLKVRLGTVEHAIGSQLAATISVEVLEDGAEPLMGHDAR